MKALKVYPILHQIVYHQVDLVNHHVLILQQKNKYFVLHNHKMNFMEKEMLRNGWNCCGLDGIPVKCLEFLWNAWISCGTHGILVECTEHCGIHGIPMEYMELLWNAWNSCGMCGILVECMNFHGYPWITMDVT